MSLEKYELKQGSKGPMTEMLQAFLNEHFDAGLDEKKFGVFGPLTEAAVNAALKTIGMEQNGVFGPDAFAASLAYLRAQEAKTFTMPDEPQMM